MTEEEIKKEAEQPAEEPKAAEEQPAEPATETEEQAEETPADEKPVEEQSADEEKPSEEKPVEEKPAEVDWKLQYARLLADFDNYKKRAARDRAHHADVAGAVNQADAAFGQNFAQFHGVFDIAGVFAVRRTAKNAQRLNFIHFNIPV